MLFRSGKETCYRNSYSKKKDRRHTPSAVLKSIQAPGENSSIKAQFSSYVQMTYHGSGLHTPVSWFCTVIFFFFFTKENVCVQLLPACRSLEIQRLSFSTLCPLSQAFCNSSNIIFFKNILVSLNHIKVYSIKQKPESHTALR